MKKLLAWIVLISTSLCGTTVAADMCSPGTFYSLSHHPCRSCLCGSDGQPTEDCVDFNCPGPHGWCYPGQHMKHVEGTCCEYECVNNVCTPGGLYTMPKYPCLSCPCGNDGMPISYTLDTHCAVQQCNETRDSCLPGQVLKHTEGTCCDYFCVDVNNDYYDDNDEKDDYEPYDERECTPGRFDFIPDDPCLAACLCDENGRPTDVCIHQCDDDNDDDDSEDDTSASGVNPYVAVCIPGEYFYFLGEPCTKCLCGNDGPRADTCEPDHCEGGSCAPGKHMQQVEGTCCNYICVDDAKTDTVCTPGRFDFIPDDPCLAACFCDENGRPTDDCIHQCDDDADDDHEDNVFDDDADDADDYDNGHDNSVSAPDIHGNHPKGCVSPHNPCKTCACYPNGQLTLDCVVEECEGPQIECTPGQTAQFLEGTCCDYECVDTNADYLDDDYSDGNNGDDDNSSDDNNGDDDYGDDDDDDYIEEPKKTECTPGEYYSSPDIPCKSCLCGYDGKPSGQCRDTCPPPNCEPGTKLRKKEGTCCGYECVDDDKPALCAPGESYSFPNDPCLSCSCFDGPYKCWSVTCPQMTCPVDYVPKIKAGTCCDYECHPKACVPTSYYTLADDPCKMCQCGPDGKPTDNCSELECESSGEYSGYYSHTDDEETSVLSDCAGNPCKTPEPCSSGGDFRPIWNADSCCPEYECDVDDYKSSDDQTRTIYDGRPSHVSYLVKTLGIMAIVGLIFAIVLCCIRQKNNKVRKLRGEQFYNNLTLGDNNDRMRILPEDKVDIVKEGDYGNDVEGVNVV